MSDIDILESQLTPERLRKIKYAAGNRQSDLTLVLENVHDPHNISAVLRSADAVGIPEIHVLETDTTLQERTLKLGKKSSAGSKRWVRVVYHADLDSCVSHLRDNGFSIYSTHLYHDQSTTLYDMDFVSQPIALVLGNEHDGVSQDLLQISDGNIVIPQVGMVESLNISVACAVILFEAFRQKLENGQYPLSAAERDRNPEIYRRYLQKNFTSKLP